MLRLLKTLGAQESKGSLIKTQLCQHILLGVFFIPQPPWAQVLRSKYLGRKGVNSRIWKALTICWGQYKIGLQWQPSNGKHVHFLTNPWLWPKNSIRSLIQAPLQRHKSKTKIDSYKIDNRWSFSELSFDFPQTILSHINSIYFPLYDVSYADKIIWGLTNNKVRTIVSCYNALTRKDVQDDNRCETDFRWIWKLSIPPNLRHFFWLIYHNRLPAIVFLYYINCIFLPSVLLCHSSLKTATYLFFKCKFVEPLWEQIYISAQIDIIISTLTDHHPQRWLRRILEINSHIPLILTVPLKVIITYCFW